MKCAERSSWLSGAAIIAVLSVTLSGCNASLGKAKHSAAVSQQVYTAVETETVSEIAAIVQKDKDGSITADDRSRLHLLNDLRKLLDRFAEAHNAYVSSLKVWETSGQKPADADAESAQLIALVRNIQDLTSRLHMKLR